MGRGLGKLQQAILHFVRQQDGPVYAEQIAAYIYGETAPSHASVVNVRRAIHALERRQLVQCGQGTYRFADYLRLYCWLPEHQPPSPPTKWMHETRNRWGMK